MSSSSDAGHGAAVFAPKRVVVATANAGKLAEIRAALEFTHWEFISVAELGGWDAPEETGATFEENARIKAVTARDMFGFAALADDSGLEVDALGGAPGVYSSRYSGEGATDASNNAKLLEALREVPTPERTARFRCVMVLLEDDGTETAASGTCEGLIGSEPRGDGGFGYDPLFVPNDGGGRTMAELDLAEKHALSHRGAALRALARALAHARG